MYGDLGELSLTTLLDQLQTQTGTLSVRDGHGHRYRIGLHQGTVQTLHVDGIMLKQRRQVVSALAALLTNSQGHFAFSACALAEFGPDTMPMNLALLLDSARQEQLRPSAAPQHHKMPCAATAFAQLPRPVPCSLPADLQDHWAALCLLLPVLGEDGDCKGVQGLSAQHLAEQLGCSVGQMRVRLFRLQEAGLVVALPAAVAVAAQPKSQSASASVPHVAVAPISMPTAAASLPEVYPVPPRWTPLPPELLN